MNMRIYESSIFCLQGRCTLRSSSPNPHLRDEDAELQVTDPGVAKVPQILSDYIVLILPPPQVCILPFIKLQAPSKNLNGTISIRRTGVLLQVQSRIWRPGRSSFLTSILQVQKERSGIHIPPSSTSKSSFLSTTLFFDLFLSKLNGRVAISKWSFWHYIILTAKLLWALRLFALGGRDVETTPLQRNALIRWLSPKSQGQN